MTTKYTELLLLYTLYFPILLIIVTLMKTMSILPLDISIQVSNEKLHYSMQIYTTVFLIVYMYLYTVVQYSYTMLSDSMNIPHSEVSTYINQYYLFTSLSIYYYGYVHVMCFYCSEGNTGNGGRSRNLFFHPAIT